jgi:glycosyltransferase involved in cell wall biosynthesis
MLLDATKAQAGARHGGYVAAVEANPKSGMAGRPRVVIVRGHQANPWELRPWEHPVIAERFDVSFLRSHRGWFDTDSLSLDSESIWTMRDLLPPGRIGDQLVRVPGDRYLGLRAKLRDADIVHTQELGYWYSMQVADLKPSLGFQMVTTVWETIPFLSSYRNVRTRAYRSKVLAQTDLFLAATERARMSLLLEGAPTQRIRVCPPGIDTRRFTTQSAESNATEPVILSPGRLVWEKGHQDVLRAVALLRRGSLPGASAPTDVRLCIVGSGPEERRLRDYARELGIADAVEFRGFIPYDEMPGVYANAACMVLASLPIWSWEEQFGMVLVEAMAAGTPILASTSGAIPEVVAGNAALFSPGDWMGLAGQLAAALEREPRESAVAAAAHGHTTASAPAPGHSSASTPDQGRSTAVAPTSDHSTEAAAKRLLATYESLLADRAAA